MRVLIIGGGIFLGRSIVTAALAKGHEVTVFNRGRNSVIDPCRITWLRGDRDNDLTALRDGEWDAVVDTCAYFPRQVRTLLVTLGGRIRHYTFISTASVYAELSKAGLSETDALPTAPGDGIEEITAENYGPLKAGCEEEVHHYPILKSLIVRPGVIVGPHDPSDRFAYWVGRISAGGDILAPGKADAGLQIIDVRDLAEWIVMGIEGSLVGVFNAIGPQRSLSFGEFLGTCLSSSQARGRLVWVSDEWLESRSMANWAMMPLFMSKSAPHAAGLFAINGSKAFAAGLAVRSLGKTVVDTQRWLASRDLSPPMKAGMSRAKEEELLQAWTAV
ncbi:MAG: NAD-dependent epimerase/dehydratase family protein [Lacunisphaera sp.]